MYWDTSRPLIISKVISSFEKDVNYLNTQSKFFIQSNTKVFMLLNVPNLIRLYCPITEHCLLFQRQHGFQKCYSTDMQHLHELKVSNETGIHKVTNSILRGLSKCLDTVGLLNITLQATFWILKLYTELTRELSQIAKFMGPTWVLPGSCRPQMGPMLAPWTLLSGI